MYLALMCARHASATYHSPFGPPDGQMQQALFLPHFTDEETEAWKYSSFPEFTEAESGRAGVWTQAAWLHYVTPTKCSKVVGVARKLMPERGGPGLRSPHSPASHP